MNAALLGPIAAFASSFTWGYGSTNYSKLSRNHRPMDVNFTRAVFAVPCFILAVLIQSRGLSGAVSTFSELGLRQVVWFSVSMISSYALGDVLFLLSTIALGVPGALAIASGYPILTALIGVFFEGQRLHAAQCLGLALAVAGIVAVILNDPKGAPSGGTEVRAHPLLKRKSFGVMLALGTALAWASNTYSVGKGGAGIDPMAGNALRMTIGLFLISAVSWISTKQPAKLLDRATLRRYSWVFIAESFLGSFLFMYGLSNSSLVLGSTLSSLAPVIAVPVSVALKLERFSWVRSLAVVTVVVGLSLIFR